MFSTCKSATKVSLTPSPRAAHGYWIFLRHAMAAKPPRGSVHCARAEALHAWALISEPASLPAEAAGGTAVGSVAVDDTAAESAVADETRAAGSVVPGRSEAAVPPEVGAQPGAEARRAGLHSAVAHHMETHQRCDSAEASARCAGVVAVCSPDAQFRWKWASCVPSLWVPFPVDSHLLTA